MTKMNWPIGWLLSKKEKETNKYFRFSATMESIEIDRALERHFIVRRLTYILVAVAVIIIIR